MEKESDRTKTKLAHLRSQTKKHDDKTWAARLSRDVVNTRAVQGSAGVESTTIVEKHYLLQSSGHGHATSKDVRKDRTAPLCDKCPETGKLCRRTERTDHRRHDKSAIQRV